MPGAAPFSLDCAYANRRSPVLARNVVAAAQPLAAQAGLQMLRRGGTAADAAVAAAAVLTVVEPTSSGLGADAFALVWHAGKCSALNASGRTPRAQPREANDERELGWSSVTIPGAVAGWAALAERFGRLPFAQLLEPAIAYAREGYLVTPIVARVWQGLRAMYKKFPDVNAAFFEQGRGPNAGALVRMPDMARSLELIAQSKGQALYAGELAERIVAHAKATLGHIEYDDLHGHACEWTTPLCLRYGGADVYEMPPNSQGVAALIALGILQRLDFTGRDIDSALSVHLQIEATKLGLDQAYRHVADPAAMRIGAEALLSEESLSGLAARVSANSAQWPDAPAPTSGGTTYLTAADSDGMVVSYIQSSGPGFGSGIVVPGTGIALQSRASAFSHVKNHPNCFAPAKRPYHTNSPALVVRDGQPWFSFGLMGWSMQPQAHVQFVLRALHASPNPQAILDAPRWRIAFQQPAIVLEPALAQRLGADLSRYGHDIVRTERFLPASTPFGSHLFFGGAQMLAKCAEGYVAAADPRRDGCAVGF